MAWKPAGASVVMSPRLFDLPLGFERLHVEVAEIALHLALHRGDT
jgi:hypothetical protein